MRAYRAFLFGAVSRITPLRGLCVLIGNITVRHQVRILWLARFASSASSTEGKSTGTIIRGYEMNVGQNRKQLTEYIKTTAPEKYHSKLIPQFRTDPR